MATHDMNLADYRQKYRDPVTGEEPPTGYSLREYHHPEFRTARVDAPVPGNVSPEQLTNERLSAAMPPEDQSGWRITPATTGLTPVEISQFQRRFKTLFYQADEDPALEQTVENIVLNEIHIERYNTQINHQTSKLSKSGKADISTLNALANLVKNTQATNLQLMASLSITRAQKQKTKSVVESTPSRFVTAFSNLVKNMTEENRRKLNTEMEDAARRMQRNLTELKHLVPQDVVVTENEELDGDDIV